MDYKKLNPNYSLKSYFKKWLLLAATLMSLFSILIISMFSFFEAKDLQDETLVHFMNYTSESNLDRSLEIGSPKGGCKEKESILDELIEFKDNFKSIFFAT